MKEVLIYQLQTIYRENMKVTGYQFGQGKQAVCIVGAMRGDEIQQIYSCGLLIKKLTELESKIKHNHSIMVIPCVNSYSANARKRFWPTDNTDINRMFPGYSQGETTQRIAAALFERIKEYEYGIHFTSFYLPRDFYPHVRLLKTGYENTDTASLFGLPYTYIREPRPYDTTTLNYNWQIWDTQAFSLYTNSNGQINESGARQCVDGILRLFSRLDILSYDAGAGEKTILINENDLAVVKNKCSGIIKKLCRPGSTVKKGLLIGQVINPCNAEVIEELYAPADGVVFSTHADLMIDSNALAFEIIE
ncbi:MAG: M14 family metallopeptidase [Lachnospiraceae bacterium]